MPPGGLEGRHSSGAVLLPAAALPGLPLPGPASKASQGNKHEHLFPSLTEDFLADLQGLSYLRFRYSIKNTLVLSYKVPWLIKFKP